MEELSTSLKKSVFQAVNVLRQGGIVAFPTETCYGLAVDPYNPEALRRLYEIKKRGEDKPLLILIDHLSQLKQCVTEIPSLYEPLMEEFWPGPLTLIFPAVPELPSLLTGASSTVAIRRSPHPVASLLVRYAGIPVTATSANLSGEPPALCVSDCREIFGDSVDYILDIGEISTDTFSTIVGIKEGKLIIIRAGVLDLAQKIQQLNAEKF